MSFSQQPESTHEHVTIAEIRANFTEIINRVAYGHELLIVDRYHKPLVALISIDDLALLEDLEDQHDLQLGLTRLKTIEKHGTKSLVSIKKELNVK